MERQHAVPGFGTKIQRKPVPSPQGHARHQLSPNETASEPLLDGATRISNDTTAMMDTSSHKTTGTTIEKDPKQSNWTFLTQEPKWKQPSSDEERPPTRWPRSRRIFKGWWQELLWCVISIVAFVALVVVLAKFNGKPLPKWPSGITLNTIIAALATISRTAFLIPVTEGLSQSKWSWFKRKPRPLTDFEMFDQASRGPWGSLGLLFRTKGWVVGILSALLLTSAIATSTLTQSVVAYPVRNVTLTTEGSAVAWRLPYYYWVTAHQNSIRSIMSPVARGIAKGLYSPVTEVLSFKEPQCLANNCTWPQFSTLAVCHTTTDLTHLATIDTKEPTVNTNISLPNGVNITIGGGYSTVGIGTGPSLSYNGTQMDKAKLYNYFAIYGPAYDGTKVQAAEVILHWCINTYSPSMTNNLLSLNKTMSHTEVKTGNRMFPDGAIGMATYLTSPADEGVEYIFGGTGVSEINNVLNSCIPSLAVDKGDNKIGTGSYMLAQGVHDMALQRDPNVTDREERNWREAVDGMARNIGTGLTNSLLGSNSNVIGTALQSEVYVRIQWPWLSLLATQILFSIILLILVIVETVIADIDIVKSSTLPAIFAINAGEKAEMERQFAEGAPFIGEDDHRLVPSGIGGELRKRDGKWVLGGT